MALRMKTQILLNKFLEKKLNSFVLNYQKTNYIISVHHNLPIDSIYNLHDQKLNIKVDSCWSEVLIIDTTDIDLKDVTINYKIQNKLPKEGQLLTIKTGDERYQTHVIDHEFIPFDKFSGDLTIPYIRSTLNESIDNLSGLSGSPVYIDDKLIGVFSKFEPGEMIAYIIPIYIVIKNILKKDNTNIYGLTTGFKINKINSYNIKDDLIYHPTLKIKIPVNTFLMLEGDSKTTFSVRRDMTDVLISYMTTSKPIKLSISNESYIVNKELEYKINARLLNLLKNMNVNKQTIICLFNHIMTSGSSPMFTIIENKINLI
jgi:hypothetical protein